MKMLSFSSRTVKEIIRDPLNLGFGLGFPIILLLLLTAIQSNVPVELFAISKLTPGITVFGFSFMTLFAAQLIAKDRETALLTNLCAWLSGTWFDLDLVGGAFKDIAYLLPFVHAVELERAALNGCYGEILPHLLWVLGWTAVTLVAAVAAFLRQMQRQ